MITSSSCGSDSSTRNNPLLTKEWDTPYNIAPLDKIIAADYMPALEVAIIEQNRIIAEIVSDSTELTFESVIVALDNSDIMISDIFNIFSMIEASNTSPKLAKVNGEMMPKLAMQQDFVLFNEELFAKVKGVWDIRHDLKLDPLQLRLTEKIYDKFVRGGALLDETPKARLAVINEDIAELRVKFSQNLLAETNDFVLELKRAQLDGLPNAVRDIAQQEGQRRGLDQTWVITLKQSSFVPFMTYSKKRELREQLYKAYINRGKQSNKYDNREIIEQVTKLRLEKARILGFENYAEYVTSTQMAGTPKAAYELLDEIWTPAIEMAKRDLEAMEEFFSKDHKEGEIEPWDWLYYSEVVREKEFALKSETLRNYFPVEGVRNGTFVLANRLYGLTFRPIITPQYGENCVSYEVIDVNGAALGLLHMDLYARPTKGQGAWCGFIREQRYEDGERVMPIVSISTNFSLPKEGGKTLLSMEEVETLFHEFGHALHFLFQDVKYRGLSEVEGDFVELPSQIMENWALEPEVLKLYAFHHSTGDVIPNNVLKNYTLSKLHNQGYAILEVAASALLDLDLHTLTDLEFFDVDIFRRGSLNGGRGLIEQIEPRYNLPYFSHLFTFDYASGYYFYLWAEVLDKDIYERFKLSGDLFNRTLANKFRSEILERGGGEDGMVMFRNFAGESPSREPFLIAKGLMERPKTEEELEAERLAEEAANALLAEEEEIEEGAEIINPIEEIDAPQEDKKELHVKVHNRKVIKEINKDESNQ
ncbi:MAG: M3 family metallopeptidase [Rikenellaceae bacterium]